MEINEMTVPEIEKIFGTMRTDYKLENKGSVRLHVDMAQRTSPRSTLEAIAARL